MNPPAAPRRAPSPPRSPLAQDLAAWLRQVERLVRTARTYGPSYPLVGQLREQIVSRGLELLGTHAPVTLRITPEEIWMRDERVAGPSAPGEEGSIAERDVPVLLHRDGVRSISFSSDTRGDELTALLDALAQVAYGVSGGDDLVTLLWGCQPQGMRLSLEPIETLVALPGTPAEEAVSADVDRFDDWRLPQAIVDPRQAWHALRDGEAAMLEDLRGGWERERALPWARQVPALVGTALALDPSPEMRSALSLSIVTWLAGAIARCDWAEAKDAWTCLGTLDVQGTATQAALASALSGLDPRAVAERLEESEGDALARFFALAVQMGASALDLVVGVLANAGRTRLRAAATTALSYLCAEQPRALARYLGDSRWQVAADLVLVLGQIGGEDAGELLAQAARHVDSRVRRAVVNALGQVPARRRIPLLLSMLDTGDLPLLQAVLAMLTRQSEQRVTRALLDIVGAIDFEARPEEARTALLAALGDVADDQAVPALEGLLNRGGWFARRTPERTAAAATLARIGTPSALAVLEAGRRSRAEAVRTACVEALARSGRAA